MPELVITGIPTNDQQHRYLEDPLQEANLKLLAET
jgi:hypothetical protein